MIIKIVTFALMAMFYVCYFTKMIAQKKQGINTDQLGKGKEGFIKFIAPTATPVAPAIINSKASSALEIPPIPMIGIFTALAT